jgi:lactate permease
METVTTPKQGSAPAPPKQTFVSILPTLCGILIFLLGALWLFSTNPAQGSWSQSYDPTGHWLLSTFCAALPLIVLLSTMAIFRIPAHIAASVGLLTAITIAVLLFHMPLRLALTTSVYGAGYGLFPICWIILPVIFLYKLTVKAGHFDGLQKSLTNITDDGRLQLLLIAFALGGFLEGAAGFGTPVAVCGAILISLGFKPLHAAGLALIADTAPVAFGGLGIPVTALSAVTGLDPMTLSKMVAILLVPFCILVPFWMIWVYAGFRSMIQVWPPILVAGLTFSFTQYYVASHLGPLLVNITAGLFTIVVLVVFLRFWKPRRVLNARGEDITDKPRLKVEISAGATFRAWLPWLVLSVMVFVWGIPQFSQFLDAHTTIRIPILGLHNFVHRVPPVVLTSTTEAAVYTFNWLTATGTAILIAAVTAGLLMGLSLKTLLKTFTETLFSTRFTFVTIAAMLALGFITRYCGLDATMGLAFARTGALYPFFGTLIGWLGTATTGSDTSSNVLFGSLQKLTAQRIHLSPVLMCSANTVGGVMAKMMAAPSIVVASTATQTYGQEGNILRFVFFHSVALGVLVGILVFLMAYVYPFTTLVVS